LGSAFSRNNTLCLTYLVETLKRKIYVGGNSAFNTHLAEIGAVYGPIDLTVLDNGEYNKAWKNIQFFPKQTVKAYMDLKAKRLMPIHSSKFVLDRHPWKEPLTVISKFSKQLSISLVTPISVKKFG